MLLIFFFSLSLSLSLCGSSSSSGGRMMMQWGIKYSVRRALICIWWWGRNLQLGIDANSNIRPTGIQLLLRTPSCSSTLMVIGWCFLSRGMGCCIVYVYPHRQWDNAADRVLIGSFFFKRNHLPPNNRCACCIYYTTSSAWCISITGGNEVRLLIKIGWYHY